ncbi:Protein of unknown function DUF573 [Macleaya cordata]|uniref:Glabrous enhancer-binding protein-like DBD domain-containing protein n=1 Tax=Macleaya cordata TaxID=56857 RepID=A0A200QNL5_MACCD|nr:Protein of unknown function DUF573 [Macleaya cordata]
MTSNSPLATAASSSSEEEEEEQQQQQQQQQQSDDHNRESEESEKETEESDEKKEVENEEDEEEGEKEAEEVDQLEEENEDQGTSVNSGANSDHIDEKKPKSKYPTTEKPLIDDNTADKLKVEKRRKMNHDPVETEKKCLPFKRVWSEGDEIVILKGMAKYMKKKGLKEPTKDMNEFLEFIKDSLHSSVTTVQLGSKLRHLKDKYMNEKKKKRSGKLNFSKPHDERLFKYSKKIWDTSPKEKDVMVVEGRFKYSKNIWDTEFFKPLSLGGGLWNKEGLLELIGSSKANEFEEKWRKQIIAEAKFFMKRIDFTLEYMKMVLEAFESSSSSNF